MRPIDKPVKATGRYQTYDDLRKLILEPLERYALNPAPMISDEQLMLNHSLPDATIRSEAERLKGLVHPFLLASIVRTAADTFRHQNFYLNTGESHLGPYLSCLSEEQDEIVRITTCFTPVRYESSILGVWFPGRAVTDEHSFSESTHLLGWTSDWLPPFANEVMAYFKTMAIFGDPTKFHHVGTYVTSAYDEFSRVNVVFEFNGGHVVISSRAQMLFATKEDSELIAKLYRACGRAGISDIPIRTTGERHQQVFSVYDQAEAREIARREDTGANLAPYLRIAFGTTSNPPADSFAGDMSKLVALSEHENRGVAEVAAAAYTHFLAPTQKGKWYVTVLREPTDERLEMILQLYDRDKRVQYLIDLRSKSQ